jgi:signal transduction histidine kinase
VSALASSVAHDLNNVLASIQTNAFLLEGRVAGEDAEALAGIAAAVALGEALPGHLLQLQVGPRRQARPLALGSVGSRLEALPRRMGRDDVQSTITLSENAGDVMIDSRQVELGFTALVALALALAPPGGKLEVQLARRSPNGARLSVRLQGARVPAFLQEGGLDSSQVGTLALPRLVGWLARTQGGALQIERDLEGRLGFDLLLLVDESYGAHTSFSNE